MALFTTFITTPMVLAVYKPARGISLRRNRKLRDLSAGKDCPLKDELRILACLHGSGNVPSTISLIESIRSTTIFQLKLFIMHLVELTERSSSIIMVRRARKNGLPFINRKGPEKWHDSIAGAFQAYRQLGRVKVRPITAISRLATMDQDICHVAETKRITLVILPFHKRWAGDDEESIENYGHGWRGVNQRVMKNAPCSVAVLVDRGLGRVARNNTIRDASTAQRVCILFFGGPDDREALELGGQMAEHPNVKVVIVRFIEREQLRNDGIVLQPSRDKCSERNYTFSTARMNREKESEIDGATLAEFRSKWEETIEYMERSPENIIEETLTIGRSGNYDLIVVGKGRFPSKMVAELAERQAEHAELGPIGDALSSSGHGVSSSILVVQQHDMAHADEVPASTIANNGDENILPPPNVGQDSA